MSVHGKTNFAFSPTLCELDRKLSSYLRHWDTYVRKSSYMNGVHRYPGEMLVACKYLVGKRRKYEKKGGVTMAYDAFPYMHSRLPLSTLLCLPP